MKTKFVNAIIFKDFDSNPFFGNLIVEDEKIVYVGEETDIFADRVIDAKHNIIMPSFVCGNICGAASIFSEISSKIKDYNYDINRLESKLVGTDVYYGTLHSAKELVKSGITAVGDNYIFPDYVAKAYADAGIRAVVGVNAIYSKTKFLKEKELEKLFEKINNQGGLISASLFCKSVIDCDESIFDAVNNIASKHGAKVIAETSETLEEVGRCANYNDDQSPVQLLENLGILDRNCMAVHCTNISEEDIMLLAKNNIDVCANFGADFKLANGITPITQMLKYGINVCLGTDGKVYNGKLDMFREMYLSAISQNILLTKQHNVNCETILKMATINGAKALNLRNGGTLETDNYADLIMIKSNTKNLNNLCESLVFSSGREDVMLTMCNGKILYENGKCNFKKSMKVIDNGIEKIVEKFA